MKKYIKPESDVIPADAVILGASLVVYDKPLGNIDNIDDYVITDGSQILAPKINLWESEEDERIYK